ncbi:MAG TPA: fumarate/nitrate reduction transcriptional regulator Fnr [Gammaproteobacteria bacterium]|nr:fumarate/nitrate reduction transcriptional regulator Fnr [Gammaproteobacteria bacterium]
MSERRPELRLINVKPACENCHVRRLCLPVSLESADLAELNQLVERRGPIKRGESIYQAGDTFTSVYAIQGGAVKTYGLTSDGQEQITGFHLSGELVGLDAINTGLHPCHAVALENTWVCEIPYDRLQQLNEQIPSLQREFVRIMSRELVADQASLMMVGKLSAEQRVMRLLHNVFQRMRQRMGNVDEIRLPMTREDIANYVGLTTETVSRVLAHLREQGILEINNRQVRFLDMQAVCKLAC